VQCSKHEVFHSVCGVRYTAWLHSQGDKEGGAGCKAIVQERLNHTHTGQRRLTLWLKRIRFLKGEQRPAPCFKRMPGLFGFVDTFTLEETVHASIVEDPKAH
jgi:hypothetical protein